MSCQLNVCRDLLPLEESGALILKHVDFKISTTHSDATDDIQRWKKLDVSAQKHKECHQVSVFSYRQDVISWNVKK